jgi:thiamine monophosphate synthase
VTGCLSRWGTDLPAWVCALGGRTPQQVRHVTAVGAGAVGAVLAISLAGVLWEWRRSGLSLRDWLDSLR